MLSSQQIGLQQLLFLIVHTYFKRGICSSVYHKKWTKNITVASQKGPFLSPEVTSQSLFLDSKGTQVEKEGKLEAPIQYFFVIIEKNTF